FVTGTQVVIEQAGTGTVAIVAAGGVTLQGSTNTTGQYSVVVLIKQATDTWLVSSGVSGYSGFCGLSGYSGFCGLSGYSGFCGLSGYSAYSGYSGSPGSLTVTKQVFTGNGTYTPSAGMVYCIIECQGGGGGGGGVSGGATTETSG